MFLLLTTCHLLVRYGRCPFFFLGVLAVANPRVLERWLRRLVCWLHHGNPGLLNSIAGRGVQCTAAAAVWAARPPNTPHQPHVVRIHASPCAHESASDEETVTGAGGCGPRSVDIGGAGMPVASAGPPATMQDLARRLPVHTAFAKADNT